MICENMNLIELCSSAGWRFEVTHFGNLDDFLLSFDFDSEAGFVLSILILSCDHPHSTGVFDKLSLLSSWFYESGV